MYENTSEEKEQFAFLVMEICANLGIKRNCKGGHKIKA